MISIMKLSVAFLCLFLTTHLLSAANVTLAWDKSTDAIVTGYNIYYGGASRVYTNEINAGNATNVTISGFVTGVTYYFAATAYSASGLESPFSSEVVYTIPNVSTQVVTYIGVKVDYGPDLITLNSKSFMVMRITNDPGYFYGEYLIITNNPFIGTKPIDTNQYVYIGTLVQYGLGLTSLNSSTFPLTTFTNLPNQYYRGSLIITNHSF